MTAFIQSPGQLEPFAFNLTDTSDRVIKASTAAIQLQIESLIAAADGAANFSLWVDKGGGVEVWIIPPKAMVSGDMITLANHPLRLLPGWSLVCAASAGNVIDVTASLLMISKSPEKLATL